MTTLRRLSYEGQDTCQLLNSAESYGADSVICAFEQAIQEKEADGVPLTVEEQITLAVKALQGEVNNGGFLQFFTNTSCEYAPMIVDCLRRIDAPKTAELAAAALATLHLRKPTPDRVRQAAEQAIIKNNEYFLDTLEDLDQRFYQLRSEKLDELLVAFIRANSERILA